MLDGYGEHAWSGFLQALLISFAGEKSMLGFSAFPVFHIIRSLNEA